MVVVMGVGSIVPITGVETDTIFVGIIVLQLVIVPILVGIFTSLFLWKRRLGSVSVRRVLAHDNAYNRVAWTLLVTSLNKPLAGCTVRFGSKTLRWEGTGGKELDIGPGGAGQAVIHDKDYDPSTSVRVKSGPFTIFRGSFRNLEEVCLNC